MIKPLHAVLAILIFSCALNFILVLDAGKDIIDLKEDLRIERDLTNQLISEKDEPTNINGGVYD